MVRCLLSALAFAVPSLAAAAGCHLADKDILGGWLLVSDEGFFEQMAFEVDGTQRVFNSWLHERPETIDARWAMKNCMLRIAQAGDPPMIQTFTVSARGRSVIELKATDGTAVARYRRIEETP